MRGAVNVRPVRVTLRLAIRSACGGRPASKHVISIVARSLVATVIVAAAMLGTSAAHADVPAVIAALRDGDCLRNAAARMPLARSDRLDRAARELAREYELRDALERAEYAALNATSLHLKGPRDDEATRAALVDGYCRDVGNPIYTEMGVYESGNETWIVLAYRDPPRPPLEAAPVAARVLELVNAARAKGWTCGRKRLPPAPPLAISDVLNAAATGHAWDMAARGRAGHDGSDGSNSGQRITRAGYIWRAAGENVAAGQRDADDVVAAWLDSPDHCRSLMSPDFTETGIAFAEVRSKDPPIYWVQVFATPR